MRTKIIIGLIFILPFVGYSQGEFNIWYFGNKAGLDFNTVPPITLLNSAMNIPPNATVSISDSLGNLLFYSDGYSVWNRTHVKMPNGLGLIGNGNNSQPVYAVKKLNENSVYYLFTLKPRFLLNSVCSIPSSICSLMEDWEIYLPDPKTFL